MYIYFILRVKVHDYHLFCCLTYSRFGSWETLYTGSFVLLLCSHHFLSAFLIFATQNGFGPSFFFSLPTPWNYPRTSGSSFWKMILRSQDLGSRRAHGDWGAIPSSPPQWTELGNRCMNIHTHAHTSISLFIFIYSHIYILKIMSSYCTYNSNPIISQGLF